MRFATALDERSEFRKSAHLSRMSVESCDKVMLVRGQ